MATRDGKFPIVGGPGKWDMMLAVFNGTRVHFKWGGLESTQFHVRELWESHPSGLEIVGISFYDDARVKCSFTTMFPSAGTGETMVYGEYNLETRKGEIDLEPLCERGILPWPPKQ